MIFELVSIVLSILFIVHYLYYIITSLINELRPKMQSEDAKFIKKYVKLFFFHFPRFLFDGKINNAKNKY